MVATSQLELGFVFSFPGDLCFVCPLRSLPLSSVDWLNRVSNTNRLLYFVVLGEAREESVAFAFDLRFVWATDSDLQLKLSVSLPVLPNLFLNCSLFALSNPWVGGGPELCVILQQNREVN